MENLNEKFGEFTAVKSEEVFNGEVKGVKNFTAAALDESSDWGVLFDTSEYLLIYES